MQYGDIENDRDGVGGDTIRALIEFTNIMKMSHELCKMQHISEGGIGANLRQNKQPTFQSGPD